MFLTIYVHSLLLLKIVHLPFLRLAAPGINLLIKYQTQGIETIFILLFCFLVFLLLQFVIVVPVVFLYFFFVESWLFFGSWLGFWGVGVFYSELYGLDFVVN